MGCGCNKAANEGGQWVIKFSDGTVSTRYDTEADARVALARTGKTGVVRAASK